MAVFVLRRLVVSFFILLISAFMVFVLVSHSGDPYADLRGDHSANLTQKMAHRTQTLHLDEPDPQRYLRWLGGAGGCLVPGQVCDLGRTIDDQEVTALLAQAVPSTLKLVSAATVLAIVLGIAVGIVSALRQYSGFDYTITFSSFLLFSLPVFWIAVLLKQYLAIRVNDWYEDPTITLGGALVLAALSGLTWGALLGGRPRRRWLVRGIAGAATLGILLYLSRVGWFSRPVFGPALVALLAFGAAAGVTWLVAGLRRGKVLNACLVTAGIGSAVQFFVTPWIQDPKWASTTNLVLLAVTAVVVATGVGFAVGGLDRGQVVRASVLTALATGGIIVTDVLLRTLPGYSRLVNGRVMATFGSQTPNFSGTYWQGMLDQITHLVLPVMAIMLVSFAGYSRYSRATMVETMSQDYVRTARSKGLTERRVILRHALRNALIPLTTLAAYDFGNILGGAVITETVFARSGMGSMFVTGLLHTDPNPVMGFYVVTAASIVVFTVLADIGYAYLDPRIRLA